MDAITALEKLDKDHKISRATGKYKFNIIDYYNF